MKVLPNVVVSILLFLQGVLVNAQIILYSQTVGGNLTVKCSPSLAGRSMFCKKECKEENVLISTTGRRVHRGRYTIEYEKLHRTGGQVLVVINQLTKADSGLYRCQSLSSSTLIEILVVDVKLNGNTPAETTVYKRTGESVVVECSFAPSGSRKYFCRDRCDVNNILADTVYGKVEKGRYTIEYVAGDKESVVFVSITQLNTLDSGLYRCAVTQLRPYKEFTVIITEASSPLAPPGPALTTMQSLSFDSEHQTETPPSTATADVGLYVGLTLAALVVLLSVAILLYCRTRLSKAKEIPPEAEYASASQANPAYENIRENGQTRSPPVDTSSVYTSIHYTASGATAANSQHLTGDNLSELTYADLNFSSQPANSSIHGKCNNVVYAVPRPEVDSKDDLCLYSTVTSF